MNRTDLHALTRQRLRDARILRDNRQWGGAYYLTGLAVECALKACIARGTARHDFPDKKRAQDSHTHELTTLLKLANLDRELQRDPRHALGVNWGVLKDWRIETRYDRSVTRAAARDIYRAATQRQTGIVPWLRQRW